MKYLTKDFKQIKWKNNKMKKIILEDFLSGKKHEFSFESEKEGESLEINIGRRQDNEVIIGESGRKTLSIKREKVDLAQTVSGNHAVITYESRGCLGRGFYIKDGSTNGTKIGDYSLGIEKAILKNKDELFFGAYGPVIVSIEEFEEKNGLWNIWNKNK